MLSREQRPAARSGEIPPARAASPYRIPDDCPWFNVVNVSGGRSSGYMLKQILDAHGGSLPERCEAVFANTGRERVETLDFIAEMGERWNVPVTWLEFDYRPDREPGSGRRSTGRGSWTGRRRASRASRSRRSWMPGRGFRA